jgi:NSS family neurotransmitter:Na+ symporter
MSNMLLPIGAFLTAIFIGWVASKEDIREELGLPDGAGFQLWRLLIRFVVPLAVAAIFIGGIIG